jgi:hypothetical protein
LNLKLYLKKQKKKSSRSAYRKFVAENPVQNKCKIVFDSETSDINKNSELIDILAKYSGNALEINPLSYAIYIRDYHSAKVLLKNGYSANYKTESFKKYSSMYSDNNNFYNLTPIDFLFVKEIQSKRWNGEKTIFTRNSCGHTKGKITFRLLSEIEPNEAQEVREILLILFKKTNGGPTPSWLQGSVSEVNKEGCIGSCKKINVYHEIIKLKWNEIAEFIFPEGQNKEIETAMLYDNEDFFEYTIRKKPGSKYLGKALNYVTKTILTLNLKCNGSAEKLQKFMKYFKKLLLAGASPNEKGNDGYRPIDYIQKFEDSSRKKELLELLFNNDAKL